MIQVIQENEKGSEIAGVLHSYACIVLFASQ